MKRHAVAVVVVLSMLLGSAMFITPVSAHPMAPQGFWSGLEKTILKQIIGLLDPQAFERLQVILQLVVGTTFR